MVDGEYSSILFRDISTDDATDCHWILTYTVFIIQVFMSDASGHLPPEVKRSDPQNQNIT